MTFYFILSLLIAYAGFEWFLYERKHQVQMRAMDRELERLIELNKIIFDGKAIRK